MYLRNNSYNKHYKLRKQQLGFGVVVFVMVFTAVLGLAISILSGDINKSVDLSEQTKTDAQNHSLQIAEELYYLNPQAMDSGAPFNMSDLCTIVSLSYTNNEQCETSVSLNVGRDGIVQFRSVALSESHENVPFAVVDGEQIQLQARANLQRQLRRIANVMEEYHYQQSVLHKGGNVSSQSNLLDCDFNPSAFLPCATALTVIPITTAIFTEIDQKTIFGTTVKYQTGGVVTLVSEYGGDGLVTIDLDAQDQNVAAVVMAETPWQRAIALGGQHHEWVIVRKRHVNE